jgi:hypothetical protein
LEFRYYALPDQRNLNRTHVRRRVAFILRKQLVSPDPDALDLHVRKKPVPDNLSHVNRSTDGSPPRFNAYLPCSAVKESDARENVVHYWLLSDQDRVDLRHAIASLLVYFLSGLTKDFTQNKYIVVQASSSHLQSQNPLYHLLTLATLSKNAKAPASLKKAADHSGHERYNLFAK